MPVVRYSQDSPPISEPNENTELVKYIDIVKFLSILKEQSLFFCRIDKLEDKFEGTLPALTHSKIVEWYKYMRDVRKYFTTPFPDDELDKKASETLSFQNKMRSLNCINCWNKFDAESYALWKIYANLNQGIMLKTTFKKLIHSFGASSEKIYCSSVKYIDYNKDIIDFGNTMSPLIHKHYCYTYENEIRLIHEVPNTAWVHNWGAEKYEAGVMIPIDLSDLFDEIVISPFSPDWFRELIADLASKYSLKCKITDSVLR